MRGIPDEVTPTFKVDDQTKTKVDSIKTNIAGIKDKIVTAKAKGDDKGLKDLEAQLRKAEKKQHQIDVLVNLQKANALGYYAKVSPGSSKIIIRKDGGFVHYANGGFEDHTAKIYRPWHSTRIFNEPETGGEAYIPLARSKRARSLAIWAQAGRELGAYANGGLSGARGPAASLAARSVTFKVYVQVPPGSDRLSIGRELYALLVELNHKGFGGRGLSFA